MSDKHTNKTFPYILVITLTIAIAILLSLGIWQLQRLSWKTSLIKTIDAAYSTPAEKFDANKNYNAFDKIRLEGTWIEKDIFIESRTHEGEVGYHIISPLKTTQGVVFVNRGWVSSSKAYPYTRANFPAILKPSKKSNAFVPDNDIKTPKFYWEETTTLEKLFELQTITPFIAWAMPSADSPNDTEPLAAGSKPKLKNDHMQYALFWFSLALALAVIGALKIRLLLKH